MGDHTMKKLVRVYGIVERGDAVEVESHEVSEGEFYLTAETRLEIWGFDKRITAGAFCDHRSAADAIAKYRARTQERLIRYEGLVSDTRRKLAAIDAYREVR
jgi:hypothetical protein